MMRFIGCISGVIGGSFIIAGLDLSDFETLVVLFQSSLLGAYMMGGIEF